MHYFLSFRVVGVLASCMISHAKFIIVSSNGTLFQNGRGALSLEFQSSMLMATNGLVSFGIILANLKSGDCWMVKDVKGSGAS